MDNLQELSDEQLLEQIDSATRVIAKCSAELQKRKRSESASSSSSVILPSPKTPKIVPEDDESDTDIELDMETRAEKGPIFVQKTVGCQDEDCKLCPLIYAGDKIENMLFPTRPLLFKEDAPSFDCHHIVGGVYGEICVNPTCRFFDKIMYFGSSGDLWERLTHGHIDCVSNAQKEWIKTGKKVAVLGVDAHFVGECYGFMRFVFLKSIKDQGKRENKEDCYMHRFGTTISAYGMNAKVNRNRLGGRQPKVGSGNKVAVKPYKPTPLKKKVPTVHWQFIAAACMMEIDPETEEPKLQATALEVADYMESHYPAYSRTTADPERFMKALLSKACGSGIKNTYAPESSNYSNWFVKIKEGARHTAAIYGLNMDNFDQKQMDEGLIPLDQFEEDNKEEDSSSSSSNRTPRKSYKEEDEEEEDSD